MKRQKIAWKPLQETEFGITDAYGKSYKRKGDGSIVRTSPKIGDKGYAPLSCRCKRPILLLN